MVLLEKLILLIVCTVGHAGGGVLVLKMRRVLGMCQVSESCVKRRRIEWLLKWTWTCRCYSLKKHKNCNSKHYFFFLSFFEFLLLFRCNSLYKILFIKIIIFSFKVSIFLISFMYFDIRLGKN